MQGTPLPHRPAAIWFADVAGYSARAAEDESGALQLIEILQALSRETVRRYEGRIVKFLGDAVVQLIDARNGYQLWSERFDREIEDIFAIQDEIARRVLNALGLSLTEREERRFLKPPTANVEAYEFYLRGRKLFHSWTRQNMEFARQM